MATEKVKAVTGDNPGLLAATYTVFKHFIKDNVPTVKSVDLFFDQFNTDNTGDTDSKSNPRVLVEIEEFEPLNLFGNLQTWEASIILHIGIDITSNFDTELEDRNLAYMGMLDEVFKGLQGISSYDLPEELHIPGFRHYNFERSNVIFATNPGPIKVSTVSFRCIVEDNSLYTEPIEGITDAADTTLTFTN